MATEARTALLASPGETLAEHVERMLGQWAAIEPRLRPSLTRLFHDPPEDLVPMVIRCHDVGKLTRLWQRQIREKPEGWKPPHAALGAAFLWTSVQWEDRDARNAAAFAIAIHHVDRGLVGANIEAPATQAVMAEIVDDAGRVRWHEDGPAAMNDLGLPVDHLGRVDLESMDVMARELRQWSRGGSYLSMHRTRMLASALHHVLKVCDVRAASERPGDFDATEHAWMTQILEGGLLA
ncbi:MAG: CRISPR-associated endonuclease Cas3'' [Armatimonadota bacterium]